MWSRVYRGMYLDQQFPSFSIIFQYVTTNKRETEKCEDTTDK